MTTPFGLSTIGVMPYDGAVEVALETPTGKAASTINSTADLDLLIAGLVEARKAAWPDEKPSMYLTGVDLRPFPGANAAAPHGVNIIEWHRVG